MFTITKPSLVMFTVTRPSLVMFTVTRPSLFTCCSGCLPPQDTASETMLTSSRRQSMYSQFSEYSGGSVKGDYDISGEILFSIEYFEGKVLVNVKLARGLAAADRNGKADPYVKTYLLPDPSKETKRKTRIVKKNLDPIFNEVLSVCEALSPLLF